MMYMHFRALLLLFYFFSFNIQKSDAQYYFYDDQYYDNPVIIEIGGSIGIMNCLTDLGGKKGIGKKFIKDLNLINNRLCG